MTSVSEGNKDQSEYWNSESGRKWVDHEDQLDKLLSSALEEVLQFADPMPGEKVLDIGCGTGASVLRLAKTVGVNGEVTGVDISAPLLDRARTRAEGLSQVKFMLADAQSYGFETQAADLVFSRFGVMFFDDPTAAMANLRNAVRPGGRMAFISWRGMPENPWFRVPFEVAVARLGRPEMLDPHAPGPTAFKDINRVTGILEDAGWTEVSGVESDVTLFPPGDVTEVARLMCSVGPAIRVLRELGGSDADAAAIEAMCLKALAEFEVGGEVHIPARLNVFTALNGTC